MRSIPLPKLILAVVGIALLTILVRCFPTWDRGASKGIVWMTPRQLSQRTAPGLLTQLKYRVLRLPGPFWRWYMSRREHILIDSRLLKLTTEAERRIELPNQRSTNAEGMSALILSAEELASLKQQLKGLPGVATANVMRFTTYDGGQAQIADGTPSAALTNSTFIGLTIDLLPKVAGSSFNLLVGATSTDIAVSPDGTVVGARTNFAAACQVLVPNSGGLVVEAEKGKNLSSTNYWLIISPVAVDALGNSKKLSSR
jgi:hypothetical protein